MESATKKFISLLKKELKDAEKECRDEAKVADSLDDKVDLEGKEYAYEYVRTCLINDIIQIMDRENS